jgi:two-component system response regulator YesN
MDRRIAVIKRIILENPGGAVSLAELAERLNLSPHRLSHLFRDEMAMSFSQYLKQVRIEKARELLETTFLTIKEIRLKIGVNDKSRFARDFKEAFGVTPTRYRSQRIVRELTPESQER